MLKIAQGFAPLLFRMKWRYAIAPIGMHFVTSDNPVFWQDASAPLPLANGLAGRGTILTFTLGPEVALVGRWQTNDPAFAYVERPFVEFVNGRIVRTAETSVFASHREDAENALRLRVELLSRGENVGPRKPDMHIIEDMSSD